MDQYDYVQSTWNTAQLLSSYPFYRWGKQGPGHKEAILSKLVPECALTQLLELPGRSNQGFLGRESFSRDEMRPNLSLRLAVGWASLVGGGLVR